MEKGVEEKFWNAVKLIKEQLKPKAVEVVSVPIHSHAVAIWSGICIPGAVDQMWQTVPPFGTGHKELYIPSLVSAVTSGKRLKANEVSDTVKVNVLTGKYMLDQYHGHYYAKARNLAILLKRVYTKIFTQYDLLLTPTLPVTCTKLPAKDETKVEWINRSFEMIRNTSPFNVSGNPAMSIPCGTADQEKKPVGLQIIGRDWEEEKIYRLAYSFEKHFNWKDL